MISVSSRNWSEFKIASATDFKAGCIEWIKQFSHAVLLDSCSNHAYGEPDYDYIVAAGSDSILEANTGKAFNYLRQFIQNSNDWLFGFFGYDLKNETENLHSNNFDNIAMPDLFFFRPITILLVKDLTVSVGTLANLPEKILTEIEEKILPIYNAQSVEKLFQLHHRVSRDEYISTVEKIREHIRNGDVYELNYSMEFYKENLIINPYAVFKKLIQYSAAPFSGFLHIADKFLLCASPERFLQKKGTKIKSQPIKGTIRRSADAVEDLQLKKLLEASIKDKAENVMITDLVRNDLTRFAETGSVQVDELFGIYSFAHVHHMVSTISAQLKEDADVVNVVQNAFPMGSMTGAPKVMAMELIEHYEKSKRGIFSGALGYITPEGDFDFNVVIRSIVYNQTNRYVSVHAGSAITWDSNPKEEYAECLLKMQALERLLQSVETT